MEVKYRATGNDRKRMAKIIGIVIGVDPIYKRAPSFTYEIDQFTVTKEGNLVFDENIDMHETETVLDMLAAEGFEADLPGLPDLTIRMPMLTGDEISKLETLIDSKASLIRKALGTENLMIGEEDDTITFPWFKADAKPEEIKAYTQFAEALYNMAKKCTRVSGKDKPVENEKYAFRCFLLRLGFIGDEYKSSRKILLQNFTGSSAFRNGGKSDEIPN